MPLEWQKESVANVVCVDGFNGIKSVLNGDPHTADLDGPDFSHYYLSIVIVRPSQPATKPAVLTRKSFCIVAI